TFRDVCEREPSRQQLRVRSQQTRLLRAIEIEATGLVTLPDAKRNEADAGQVFVAEPKKLAARLRIEILHDRHRRFANKGESPGAGGASGGVLIGVEPEDPNGDDYEAAAGEEGDGGQAAFAAPGAAAQAEVGEREAGGMSAAG